jgi:hypothetical protein
MSHYLSGILKIIVIEAFMALLIIDRLTGEKYERLKHLAFTALTTAMVFGWAGSTSPGWVFASIPMVWLAAWVVRAALGRESSDRATALRQTLTSVGARFKMPPVVPGAVAAAAIALGFCWVGVRNDSITWVHQHEQFHFVLAAKYQREVGWFDLYTAAVMADRETLNVMNGVTRVRDNHTFEEHPVEEALKDSARIRAKFTDERWAAFKADWVTMAQAWPWMNWQTVVSDHGNSNSPAWSLVAAPLVALFPVSKQNQSMLGLVDLLLMLALFITVYEAFGFKVASVGLFMWAVPPLVFDYLSGSFLRWDWLFATGVAACCLKKERWGLAGVFFGYAVATKLFPILFGLALLVPVAFEWRSTRVFRREWKAFAVGTVVTGGVCVVLATALFGVDAWKEYAERIQVAQVEKYYHIQYSLKTVFLQAFAPGDGGLAAGIFPPVIKQSLPDVDIRDYGPGFWLARLAFTAVLVVLLRRATFVEAFLLGPLLVFTWLTVNMYYWNMFGLLALGLASRPQKPFLGMLLGFFAIFVTFYTYQHLNRGFAEGYVVALLMVGLTLVTAFFEGREQVTAVEPSATPVKA